MIAGVERGTPLAKTPAMRKWIVAGVMLMLAGVGRPAAAESLWEAELRLGYGVALGGGEGMTSKRASPLTIQALAAVAVNSEPELAAFGGLVVETLDRSGVGAVGGVRMNVGPIRVAGGGEYMFAPDTLWGAFVSGGTCKRMAAHLSLCGDLELTAYFAGSDLAENHTVTQIQAVFGVVVDGP